MKCRWLLAAAASASMLVQLGCSAAGDGPNIVLLLIDTLRRDHVGTYGYERDTTPFIDELARNGVVFERAVAQAPWTTPSMASLWTSRYPSWLGVGAAVRPSGVHFLGVPTGLGPDVPTLAELLSSRGYSTIGVVPNALASQKYGLLRGFESQQQKQYGTRAKVIVDAGLKQLDEQLASGTAEPFFLYLHFMDTHEPVNPPAPFDAQFPVSDEEPHSKQHRVWSFTKLGDHKKPGFESFRSHKLALYDGAIAFIDSQIRRLVDELETRGVLENSVIVIASDHGEEFWDHPEFEAKFESHTMKGGGGAHGHSMFGELLDVPLIFTGRGVSPDRVDRQVRNLDILPTVLGLAGIRDRSLKIEGVDLFSKAQRTSASDLLSFSEDISYGYEVKALSDGRFKYLQYTGHPQSLEFLFDRSVDPGEMQDVATANPDALASLRAATLKMMEANGRGTGEPVSLDADDIEELRALGYIE
jgi:arylsulfatase A-like enzyme